MWFYWCITAAASLFVGIGSACFYNKNRKTSHIIFGVVFVSLAIIIFCIVAAFRDPYLVGTDTKWYGIWDFSDAKDVSFGAFSTIPRLNRYSMFDKFIIWMISYFPKNFFIYLFIYELLIAGPFIIVILLYLKKDAWIGVAVFGCIFFPETFNIMRQYQAEAFCLVAAFLLMRDKPIRSLIFYTIGVLFHTSALVAVPIYPIYYYLKWNDKIGFKNIYLKCAILVACAAIGCIFFSKPIFQFLFAHSETYRAYVNETQATGYALITFFSCFFMLFSTMFLLFKKKKTKNKHEIYYLLVLCLIGVCAYSLGLRYEWLFRLGYYYFAFFVLFFPKLINNIDDKHEAILMSVVITVFILSYSYFSFDVKQHANAVPYVFSDNINLKL